MLSLCTTFKLKGVGGNAPFITSVGTKQGPYRGLERASGVQKEDEKGEKRRGRQKKTFFFFLVPHATTASHIKNKPTMTNKAYNKKKTCNLTPWTSKQAG